MLAMCGRLDLIAVLVSACFLTGQSLSAQTEADASSQVQSDEPCSSTNNDDNEPTGPEIDIAEVVFSGALQMPIAEQDQIADSIKQKTHGTNTEAVRDEALERARAGWQNLGYFKVQVRGESRVLTKSPASQRIVLSVHVDEGPQYRLKEITFKNNSVFTDTTMLRGLFLINDGDIFSRDKIAEGLEKLRQAYGELGYINFTSVPDTKYDDEDKLISSVIDIDEGRQFYVGSIKVFGLDEGAKREFLSTLPFKRGQVYTCGLWEWSLKQNAARFSDCGCHGARGLPPRLNETSAAVTVTFDFRCAD